MQSTASTECVPQQLPDSLEGAFSCRVIQNICDRPTMKNFCGNAILPLLPAADLLTLQQANVRKGMRQAARAGGIFHACGGVEITPFCLGCVRCAQGI